LRFERKANGKGREPGGLNRYGEIRGRRGRIKMGGANQEKTAGKENTLSEKDFLEKEKNFY